MDTLDDAMLLDIEVALCRLVNRLEPDRPEGALQVRPSNGSILTALFEGALQVRPSF